MPGFSEGTMSRLPEEETGLRSGDVSQCCPHRSQTVPHDRFLKKLLVKGSLGPRWWPRLRGSPLGCRIRMVPFTAFGAVFPCFLSSERRLLVRSGCCSSAADWAAHSRRVSQGPGGPRSGWGPVQAGPGEASSGPPQMPSSLESLL